MFSTTNSHIALETQCHMKRLQELIMIKEAQAQLVQAEKMASLGQLTPL